jgi:serine O-acetyltransferase
MDAALVGGVHLMTSPHNGNGNAHEPGVPTLREAIRGDLAEMARRKGTRFPSLGGAIDILSLPGTWSVILFRVASTAHHKGLRPVSRLVFFLNCVVFGSEMHPGAFVQPGLVVPHPVGMGFASGVRIGRRVLMLRNTAMGGGGNPKRRGHPSLGDDVILMDSARVLGPVHVGDRTMIGTDAVVADDIPPDMFVHGPRRATEMRPLAEMGLTGGAKGIPVELRESFLAGAASPGAANGHAVVGS